MIGRILIACALLSGCHFPAPSELVDARLAYKRAQVGPAATRAPAELHLAKLALDKAEEGLADHSGATKDLAYIAQRRIELAEVVAAKDKDRGALADAERRVKEREALLAAAEQHAEVLSPAPAPNNDVEPRGVVVTIADGVLFGPGAATLLPSAQPRFAEILAVLLARRDRVLTVEGYSDSLGTEPANLEISRRRAESVRDALVEAGYPREQIRVRAVGSARAVGDNRTAAGRAENRRVEIIIAPPSVIGTR